MRPILRPRRVAVLALACLLAAIPAFGQGAAGPRKGARKYDPAAEITVRGTVLDVKTVMMPSGPEAVRLLLDTEAGETEVELGPSSFLTEKGLEPAKGDKAVVIGSTAVVDGASLLLAREIKLGGKTVALRDAQGIPAWPRGPHR